MAGGPQTDQDWTIHSLNIHGTFFERWCQKIIQNDSSWGLVSKNYPVAYKPLDSHWSWRESELDIRAMHGGYQGRSQNRRHLTLLIECKKNNREFIEWIFFVSEPRRLNYFPCVETKVAESHLNDCAVTTSLLQASLEFPVTENGRETRGTYLQYQAQRNSKNLQNITKTSNDAITKAAQQVALATQAIVTEEVSLGEHFGRFNPANTPIHDKHVFLPTVVTTAKLFVCEFDDKHVDGLSGEIAYDRVRLTPSPCLVYRMPLPPHLQRKPDPSVKEAIVYGSHEVHTRMDILVVNSGEFENFLKRIPVQMSHAL
jgi:hypothetical protein